VNTPFFIAKRYLFSKKSQNVINIISSISVLGVVISTAAMVIVLSAFNGVEGLVVEIFSAFESDIKIKATNSKTFNKNFIDSTIFNDDRIVNYTPVVEETVIIKNHEQFSFATMKGVNNEFLQMVNMEKYLLDGEMILSEPESNFGLVGVGVLQNLGGYIYQIQGQYDYFTLFSPNRNEKIKRNSTAAFDMTPIPIAGTFSFNNKIDADIAIVPIDYAIEILGYENDISAFEIDYKDDVDLESIKEELQQKIGSDFSVKTAYEQNELIHKTSKSEKWLTIILLGFIFFLGTFNMIASIAMLVIEKRNNIETLKAMGVDQNQLHKIFFYVGLMINGLGTLIGIFIGYLVCYLQQSIGLLRMEGGMVEFFPVDTKISDFFLILTITFTIGALAALVTSKFLIKKTI
jgi:ABC-type lipoprotein release transport system permease subunit